jgi:chromosome segregation ATPase
MHQKSIGEDRPSAKPSSLYMMRSFAAVSPKMSDVSDTTEEIISPAPVEPSAEPPPSLLIANVLENLHGVSSSLEELRRAVNRDAGVATLLGKTVDREIAALDSKLDKFADDIGGAREEYSRSAAAITEALKSGLEHLGSMLAQLEEAMVAANNQVLGSLSHASASDSLIASIESSLNESAFSLYEKIDSAIGSKLPAIDTVSQLAGEIRTAIPRIEKKIDESAENLPALINAVQRKFDSLSVLATEQRAAAGQLEKLRAMLLESAGEKTDQLDMIRGVLLSTADESERVTQRLERLEFAFVTERTKAADQSKSIEEGISVIAAIISEGRSGSAVENFFFGLVIVLLLMNAFMLLWLKFPALSGF